MALKAKWKYWLVALMLLVFAWLAFGPRFFVEDDAGKFIKYAGRDAFCTKRQINIAYQFPLPVSPLYVKPWSTAYYVFRWDEKNVLRVVPASSCIGIPEQNILADDAVHTVLKSGRDTFTVNESDVGAERRFRVASSSGWDFQISDKDIVYAGTVLILETRKLAVIVHVEDGTSYRIVAFASQGGTKLEYKFNFEKMIKKYPNGFSIAPSLKTST